MFNHTFINLFWWLMVGHVLCDYPLQGDFLAKGKNHTNPLPGIPFNHCLIAHALIHGGMVALVTGKIELGCLEFVCHAWIDFGKCDGFFGYNFDQFLHVLCKFVWIGILLLCY